MHPITPMAFESLKSAAPLVQSDCAALAHQLVLCRSDQSGWSGVAALARSAQAFAAQHLVSAVLLLSTGAYTVFWLVE